MNNLNKLIGIPFKLDKKDFLGCDCRGIVWLYFSYIKNKVFPFSDGGEIFHRDKSRDLMRMVKTIRSFSTQVAFNELKEGDIIILRSTSISRQGALGVCINDKQVLHMDKIVGSCLTKLRYLKELFLFGFRPND